MNKKKTLEIGSALWLRVILSPKYFEYIWEETIMNPVIKERVACRVGTVDLLLYIIK